MVYRSIAEVAARLWQQRGVGRVAAVALVLLAALGLALLRYGVSHSAQLARQSGLACGLRHDEEMSRAGALVQELGWAARETTWHGNPAWLADDVTVALLSMASPCDTVLTLRTCIAEQWPATPTVPANALLGYDVRRSFDVAGATLVGEGAGHPVELVRSLRLAALQASTLKFHRDELADVAIAWRSDWFARALRIAAGQEQPPPQMLFRPGKDPASRLREVEAFLRDTERQRPSTPADTSDHRGPSSARDGGH